MSSGIVHYFRNKLRDRDLSELVKGSSISFVLFGIGKLLGFIFVLMITRHYSEKIYGYVALGLTVMYVFSTIGRLGYTGALLRFVSEYSSLNQLSKAKDIVLKSFWSTLIVSLIMSLIFFFSSTFIAVKIFHDEALTPYFRIMAFAVLPYALLQIFSESIRGLKKVTAYSFFINASSFLFACGAILLFWTIADEPVYSASAYLTGLIISAILAFIYYANKSHFFSTISEHSMTQRELLNISFPMLLAGSLLLVINWTDNICIGIFRDDKGEVGIYDIAFRVAFLAGSTLQSINNVSAPKFAEYYAKKDMLSLAKVVKQSSKLIFWTSLPVMLIFVMFPKFVLNIFGSGVTEGWIALEILLIAKFISAICGPVGFVMHMTGKQKQFQYIILIAAVLNLVLNVALVPQYGMNGAAIASATSVVSWNIITAVVIHRNYGFYPFYFPFSRFIFTDKPRQPR